MARDIDASNPPGVEAKEVAVAETAVHRKRIDQQHSRYKWVALSNTTLGGLLASINASIVLISLPAIFRGIGLNPLAPGNVSYLLWMLMGYLVVSAVLVLPLRAIAFAFDLFRPGGDAVWLICWRLVQGIGGAMLMACSAAILTDAFPSRQRGMALGVNQVAAIAGQFLGLLIGGLLSEWDWRAVFWIGVPLGVGGTVWSFRSLREVGVRTPARLDWPGTVLFGVGLTVLLAAITYGIQPYGGHPTGWTNPWVLGSMTLAVAALVTLYFVESRATAPMLDIRLFRSKPFALGNLAGLMASVGRGGLQFMLIIWLQGIWLPLYGYSFESTPLWSGIYMLPMTLGFLLAGPLSGTLSDRFGSRPFAIGGLVLMAMTFVALALIPVDFDYRVFALLIFLNGLGGGVFTAPNTAAIMSSAPSAARGAASGIRATVTNAGMSLSIGIFFSLMIAGLAHWLPCTPSAGLQ